MIENENIFIVDPSGEAKEKKLSEEEKKALEEKRKHLKRASEKPILSLHKYEKFIVDEKGSITVENSEIKREFIEQVEASMLAIDDKVNILLTKAGLKPSSGLDIVIKTEYQGETTEHLNEGEVEKILDLVKRSGIPYEIWKQEIMDEEMFRREHLRVLVARGEKELKNLKEALESNSPQLIGQAYGFPKSAIEAFNHERPALDAKTLSKEMQKTDAMIFSTPTLSADNWPEEIKQGQSYADFLKMFSPKIYQEYKETVTASRELK